jgi:hypothetical protein
MKHLELFKQGFDSTLAEKVRPENWPFVGHDVLSGEVVYTAIPTSVEGPADNEIWYTTLDKSTTRCFLDHYGRPTINTYDDIGKWIYEEPINMIYISSISYYPCFGDTSPDEWKMDYNIESIILPNSVEEIGPSSFGMLRSLKEIVIPISVKTIISPFFENATGVTIKFNGTKEQWSNIELSEKWNYNSTEGGEKIVEIIHCTDGDVEI